MVWEEFERPGAIRAFRVILPEELQGEHWFDAQPVAGGTLVRHTIDGEAVGEYEAIWRDRIEPAHDRILEAVLDNIEAAEATAPAGQAAVTLTEDMRRVVLEQKLGFVATVCPDGTPNLSPKGTTTVWDDTHLLFADIRSPNTVRNLRDNPSIEVNVVDPIVRKGYRFKGRAELHTGGEVYEHGLRLLAGRGFDARRERIKTIVRIRVEQAVPLVSPAYDGGASENEVAARWEAHAETLAKRRHTAR